MANVVWLANNITHYHRARADAFARQWPGSFTILELSNRDDLSVLHGDACDAAETITLFPETMVEKIPRQRLRAAIVTSLEKTRPNVCCLNGWGLPGTVVMMDWALRRQIPCVLMSDSTEHDSPRKWWKEAIKQCLVTQCDTALVAGSSSRKYVTRLGMPPQRVFDGYDVVDNEHFRSGAGKARASEGRARGSLNLPREYFVTCARFDAVKNLHGLIRGFARFVRQAGERAWSLVIVGDGPSRNELESLSKDLGVGEKIIFKGLVGYQELPSIYALSKALVHPSTGDTWGLVVNEAMAAGLPVLVSERCGCAEDLVRDGVNGIRFDPLNLDEIAGAMLAAHRDPALLERMGQESAAIIRGWDLARFAENLRKAIDTALESRSRRARPLSKAVVWAMALQ